MTRLFRLLLLSTVLLLTSCSGAPWYSHQGINITECGPATAAMTLRWAGANIDRHRARQEHQTAGQRWTLEDIASYLKGYGLHTELRDDGPETELKPDSAYILLVRKAVFPHFVLVTQHEQGEWWVHDSFSGSRWKRAERVRLSMTTAIYLKVTR